MSSFKKNFPTVRRRRTHGAGEEGLWAGLGQPAAGQALTFVITTVVAITVRRTEVACRPLGRRPRRAGAALHPGPFATSAREEEEK